MAPKILVNVKTHAPPKRTQRRNNNEWNMYLTDADKFKLSKEETLRRKKLYISKHNILTSSPNSILSVKSGMKSDKRRVVRTRKTALRRPADNGDDDDDDDISATSEDITSLDLLTANDEGDKRATVGAATALTRPHARVMKRQQQQQQQQQQQEPRSTTALHSPIKQPAPSASSSPATPSVHSSVSEDTHLSPRQQRQPARSSTSPGTSRQAAKELSLTQRELREIGTMVDALHREVGYYEQLTGKRSALDVEELKLVVGMSGEEGEQWEQKSPVTVMRYLVHLVCQSMSHLLQGEKERATQQAALETLTSKVELLLSLNSYSPNPALQQQQQQQQPAKQQPAPSTPARQSSDDQAHASATPLTDRTLDLYASPSSPHYHQHYQYSGGGDEVSTPVVQHKAKDPIGPSPSPAHSQSQSQLATPQFQHQHLEYQHKRESGGGLHKVRFRLDSEEGDSASSLASTSAAGEGLQLGGSATSDWLFSAASSLASVSVHPFNQTLRQPLPSSSSSGDGRDATADLLQHQELHTPPRTPTSPGTPPGSARVLELQRQLAMLRQQPATRAKSSSQHPQQLGGSSRPAISSELRQAAVRVQVPAVAFTARGALREPDSESDVDQNQEEEEDEADRTEGMSFTSIPSQFLPQPQQPPSHPFQYQHQQAPQSLQMQGKSVYDARKGAFSAH